MDWYVKIREWYQAGVWNEKMLQDAVGKGKITELQYKEICGQEYIRHLHVSDGSTATA